MLMVVNNELCSGLVLRYKIANKCESPHHITIAPSTCPIGILQGSREFALGHGKLHSTIHHSRNGTGILLRTRSPSALPGMISAVRMHGQEQHDE
ncbi:hypothetical protein NQ318_006770 [Aromia moschata]|uniref:Uncharacterized protein n=1 Tax=Aromia moschata TaxID=1265417 RepID=A0AAV8Y7X7_9CUCU|nr:hypothetical protein NQ318_006770 [Aromia moschata]